MRVRIVLTALCAGTSLTAGALSAEAPTLVDGAGVVSVSSAVCLHPPAPGPLHLTLTPASETSEPTAQWHVVIEGASALGCPVAAAAACAGVGRLAEGVDVGGCLPAGGTGRLEPVVVCIPGPQRPPAVTAGRVAIKFQAALGSFDGDLTLLLVGRAVEEAANLCL